MGSPERKIVYRNKLIVLFFELLSCLINRDSSGSVTERVTFLTFIFSGIMSLTNAIAYSLKMDILFFFIFYLYQKMLYRHLLIFNSYSSSFFILKLIPLSQVYHISLKLNRRFDKQKSRGQSFIICWRPNSPWQI